MCSIHLCTRAMFKAFLMQSFPLNDIVFFSRRRRKRHHGNQKHFPHHHLTPDTSLSKNSGPKHGDPRSMADPRLDPRLDPRNDPRLPKVGSNSLWFGSPSLYTASPSQVYQDMKRKGSNRPQQEQPPGLPGNQFKFKV